jgi:hypothetical protein
MTKPNIFHPNTLWPCLTPFRQAFGVLGLFIVMILTLSSLAQADLKYTEATGRAVIQDGADASEARMMALEDALYLAALQGGAKIDGFSAVNTDTSLNDFLVVRPASMIMDYTIINEMEDDTHYTVVIRAILGEKNDAGCNRPVINATLYKPVVKIGAKVPGWASAFSPLLMHDIAKSLSLQDKIALRNASNKEFSATHLTNNNDAFDYAALTGGVVRVSDGDFALVPEIRMTHERSGSGLIRQENILLTLTLHGYHGRSYDKAFSKSTRVQIPIKRSTPLTTIDQLTQKTRDDLTKMMLDYIPNVVEAAISGMSCEPLQARLVLSNNSLLVPFGRNQGLNEHSLAVTSNGEMNWTVLRVASLTDRQAQLVPLNANRDLATLAGKTVEFMELAQ